MVAIDRVTAASLQPEYFGPIGGDSKLDKAPTSILGEDIISGVHVQQHRYGSAKYPDKGFVIAGKGFDLYVDLTPVAGVRIPLVYRLEHGVHDQRDIPKSIVKKRATVMSKLEYASDVERLGILETFAFTQKNVHRLNNMKVANSSEYRIKDVIHKAKLASVPENHVEWDRVCRYYKGYRGELNASATKRNWSRVVYRPIIMYKAMLRTFRNPDEVGSKGTRTFWSNIPTGIAVSVIVSAMALAYLNHSTKHSQQQIV